MSVCAAAPSPCLPSKNVFPPKRRIVETSIPFPLRFVDSTFRLFDVSAGRRFGGKAFRRQSVSAATFFGGKAFRRQRFSAFRLHVAGISGRQRFSAFRLHVAGISGRLFGAARGSADRRPTLTAETPKRAKRAKRAKGCQKPDLFKIGTSPAFHVEQLKNVPRGTPTKY